MLPFPVLGNDDLARIVHINDDGEYPGFASYTVRGLFETAKGGNGSSSASRRSRRRSRRPSPTVPG